MMSQIYIALSFSLLNVLAYHSDATTSVSQYNPILPLSIFIFNWVMIRELTVRECCSASTDYSNVSHQRNHGKVQSAEQYSV